MKKISRTIFVDAHFTTWHASFLLNTKLENKTLQLYLNRQTRLHQGHATHEKRKKVKKFV